MSKKFLSPIKLAQGASVPSAGSSGELFYNTTDSKIYTHNGTSWVPAGGGVSISDTEPSTASNGDGWFYSEDGTLFIKYNDGTSTQWVQPNAVVSSEVEQKYYSPNYVINGAFDIWQRGTSFSNPSSYTADRWIAYTAGTASRSTDVPNNFFKYSMALSHTSASYNIIQQRIESSNSIALGKNVTLSFWAKGTAGTNNLQIALYYANTVDGHSAQTFISQSGITTSAPSTTWTRYSRTITLPDVAVTNGWEFRLFRDDSSINGWMISGVQLEQGVLMTSFRRNANSIQGELAACQRYYYRQSASASNSSLVYGSGNGTGGTTPEFQITLPVSMRIPPTAIDYQGLRAGVPAVVTYTVSSASLNTGKTSTNVGCLTVVTTGNTVAREYIWLDSASSSSYLGFSAEL